RPPVDDGAAKPGGSVSPHALYNIGNHSPERLDRLIALIEAACGRPAIREPKPMQPGDVAQTFADVSALTAATGFTPATPLEDGVARF
ncbi:hypothetical protein ABTK84_19765, partial [Acinetobacter baumannii]